MKSRSLWNPDPEEFEAWLKTLPDAKALARLRKMKKIPKMTDKEKRELEERLKPYRTPVTLQTLLSWVGRKRW